MKHVKKWWGVFISPTPKNWKVVRNFFGTITAAITAGLLGVNAVGLVLPDNTLKYLGYAVFVSGFITAYAQSHEAKPVEKKRTPRRREIKP